MEEVAGAVSDLVAEGKVCFFGLSEAGAANIRLALFTWCVPHGGKANSVALAGRAAGHEGVGCRGRAKPVR